MTLPVQATTSPPSLFAHQFLEQKLHEPRLPDERPGLVRSRTRPKCWKQPNRIVQYFPGNEPRPSYPTSDPGAASEEIPSLIRAKLVLPDQEWSNYKTVIPAEYWNELDFSLPQNESVVIKRWPEGELPETGLNLAKPNERREILEAFARIRQFLLQ